MINLNTQNIFCKIFLTFDFRIDKERVTLSRPDETTCKIVINSTLPDDKGTWRIIIEAEENKNNQNTYEYLHILDVQVYRKYMNVTSKYFFLLHRKSVHYLQYLSLYCV